MGNRILFILLIVVVIFAADTDNFDIIVQCQYLDISLKQSASHTTDFTEWDLGFKAAGDAAEIMPIPGHIWVGNGCNINIDFSAYVSSPVPDACPYGTETAWMAGLLAAENTFDLDFGVGTSSAQPSIFSHISAETAPGDTYATDIPAGTAHDLFARFRVPTSVSDGCEHSLTVTVVATPH